jgi:ketosteroid isomerase-like protein
MGVRPVARFAALWLLGGALSAIAGQQAPSPTPSSDETAAIRQLITAYARSVDTVDTALASTIWADIPEVSFIHPKGHQRGWDSIKAGVYEQAMGQTFSERRLTVRDVVIHCHGDSAWAEFYWDFKATLRKDGSPVATRGRETQVYWRLKGAWRLVHVHYSAMPVTGEREGS